MKKLRKKKSKRKKALISVILYLIIAIVLFYFYLQYGGRPVDAIILIFSGSILILIWIFVGWPSWKWMFERYWEGKWGNGKYENKEDDEIRKIEDQIFQKHLKKK